MGYRLNNSVLRDPDGRVKFVKLRESTYDHYQIGVWLEADSAREMDQVARVEYQLHPSFSEQMLTSTNRASDFSVTFWSWGTFVIHATLHFIGAGQESVRIERQLEYALPADDGTNYVKVPAPT